MRQRLPCPASVRYDESQQKWVHILRQGNKGDKIISPYMKATGYQATLVKSKTVSRKNMGNQHMRSVAGSKGALLSTSPLKFIAQV